MVSLEVTGILAYEVVDLTRAPYPRSHKHVVCVGQEQFLMLTKLLIGGKKTRSTGATAEAQSRQSCRKSIGSTYTSDPYNGYIIGRKPPGRRRYRPPRR